MRVVRVFLLLCRVGVADIVVIWAAPCQSVEMPYLEKQAWIGMCSIGNSLHVWVSLLLEPPTRTYDPIGLCT